MSSSPKKKQRKLTYSTSQSPKSSAVGILSSAGKTDIPQEADKDMAAVWTHPVPLDQVCQQWASFWCYLKVASSVNVLGDSPDALGQDKWNVLMQWADYFERLGNQLDEHHVQMLDKDFILYKDVPDDDLQELFEIGRLPMARDFSSMRRMFLQRVTQNACLNESLLANVIKQYKTLNRQDEPSSWEQSLAADLAGRTHSQSKCTLLSQVLQAQYLHHHPPGTKEESGGRDAAEQARVQATLTVDAGLARIMLSKLVAVTATLIRLREQEDDFDINPSERKEAMAVAHAEKTRIEDLYRTFASKDVSCFRVVCRGLVMCSESDGIVKEAKAMSAVRKVLSDIVQSDIKDRGAATWLLHVPTSLVALCCWASEDVCHAFVEVLRNSITTVQGHAQSASLEKDQLAELEGIAQSLQELVAAIVVPDMSLLRAAGPAHDSADDEKRSVAVHNAHWKAASAHCRQVIGHTLRNLSSAQGSSATGADFFRSIRLLCGEVSGSVS